MNWKLKSLAFGALALTLSAGSLAEAKATLASFCYAREDQGQMGKVEGTNAQKRLPIASVSKIATAHWAIISKGPDYRFETRFHVTPVAGTDLFDVHIEGSRDPLFGKQSLHYAISELNKKNVKKIRNLTFDEGFKFFWNVTASDVAQRYFPTSGPSADTVEEELKSHSSLTAEYSSTLSSAKSKGIAMVATPAFTVKSIEFKKKVDAADTAETKVYAIHSSPVATLIKEMNRNSNNHAANQIFEHMGGRAAYPEFIKTRLGLEEKDIRFLNGSGDRYMVDEDHKIYNEASCESMVKIIHDMRMELKSKSKSLTTVLAVAGGDDGATVHMYENDQTRNALVAKTGTINTDITLAGLVLTKKGNFYFLYNIATDGPGDWASARAMIRTKLTEWVRTLGGREPISYSQIQFMSFDAGSNMIDVQAVTATP